MAPNISQGTDVHHSPNSLSRLRLRVARLYLHCGISNWADISIHLETLILEHLWLLLHLRPNYIHSASNDIHTDGPRATARARG